MAYGESFFFGGPYRVICMRSTDEGWHWTRFKDVTEGDSAYTFAVAIAKGDTIHVLWERSYWGQGGTVGTDIYWRWAKDTVWGPVVNLTNQHWLITNGLWPVIVADTFGVVHVVSRYYSSPGNLRYFRRARGVWRDTSLDYDGALPNIIVDGLGEVHLTYTRSSMVWYRKRSVSGFWTPEELVSDSFVRVNNPQVVLGNDLRPRVLFDAWRDFWVDQGIFYSERLASGAWSGPDLISRTSDLRFSDTPAAAMDSLNRLWVGWSSHDTIGHWHFWLMGRRHDGARWDSLTILRDTTDPCRFISFSERVWDGGVDAVWERGLPHDSAAVMYGWWPFLPSGVVVERPVEQKGVGLQLSVRSPVRSQLMVRYFLPQSAIQNQKSKVSLYDLSGRLVAMFNEGVESSGWHELKAPLNRPSGVYFLRLEAGKSSLTRKFVLLR